MSPFCFASALRTGARPFAASLCALSVSLAASAWTSEAGAQAARGSHAPPPMPVHAGPNAGRTELGALRVSEGLSHETVRRVVRRNFAQLSRCYTELVARDPTVTGHAMVRFVIGPTGRPRYVSAEAPERLADLSQCLHETPARWQFPRPANLALVTVEMPLRFGIPSETARTASERRAGSALARVPPR